MKAIKQFIYDPSNEKYNPAKTSWTKNLFSAYGQVTSLGIQGEPGVRFCLNGSDDENFISIGATGIYEINLDGLGSITDLRFLNHPENDSDIVKTTRLIVDIIYENGNGGGNK